MSSSSYLRTIVGQIPIHQKELLFQGAGHFTVPVQQRSTGSPKKHDAPMLTADNFIQLGAGRQPYAQHHTVLVAKKLFPGTSKPQRRDKLEGVYCGDGLSHFPEYSSVIFMTRWAIWVFIIWCPCFLCTKKSVVCMQICRKERSRGGSPANVYLTPR